MNVSARKSLPTRDGSTPIPRISPRVLPAYDFGQPHPDDVIAHAKAEAAECASSPSLSQHGSNDSLHQASYWTAAERGTLCRRSSVDAWPVLGVAVVSTRAANPVVSLSALSDPASLPSEFRSGAIPCKFPWAYALVHDLRGFPSDESNGSASASTPPEDPLPALKKVEAAFGPGRCFLVQLGHGAQTEEVSPAASGAPLASLWAPYLNAPVLASLEHVEAAGGGTRAGESSTKEAPGRVKVDRAGNAAYREALRRSAEVPGGAPGGCSRVGPEDAASLRAWATGLVRGPLADAMIARVAQARARVDRERKGLGNTFKSLFAGGGGSSPTRRGGGPRISGLPSAARRALQASPSAEMAPAQSLFPHESKQMEALWLASLCSYTGEEEEARSLLAAAAREFQAERAPLHAAEATVQVLLLEIKAIEEAVASASASVGAPKQHAAAEATLADASIRALNAAEPLVRKAIALLEQAFATLLSGGGGDGGTGGPLQLDLPIALCPPYQPGLQLRPAAEATMQEILQPSMSPDDAARAAAAGSDDGSREMDREARTAGARGVCLLAGRLAVRWANCILSIAAAGISIRGGAAGARSTVAGTQTGENESSMSLAQLPRLLVGAAMATRRIIRWEPRGSVAQGLLHEKSAQLLAAAGRSRAGQDERRSPRVAVASFAHHFEQAAKCFMNQGLHDAALWCCEAICFQGADVWFHPCPATHLSLCLDRPALLGRQVSLAAAILRSMAVSGRDPGPAGEELWRRFWTLMGCCASRQLADSSAQCPELFPDAPSSGSTAIEFRRASEQPTPVDITAIALPIMSRMGAVLRSCVSIPDVFVETWGIIKAGGSRAAACGDESSHSALGHFGPSLDDCALDLSAALAEEVGVPFGPGLILTESVERATQSTSTPGPEQELARAFRSAEAWLTFHRRIPEADTAYEAARLLSGLSGVPISWFLENCSDRPSEEQEVALSVSAKKSAAAFLVAVRNGKSGFDRLEQIAALDIRFATLTEVDKQIGRLKDWAVDFAPMSGLASSAAPPPSEIRPHTQYAQEVGVQVCVGERLLLETQVRNPYLYPLQLMNVRATCDFSGEASSASGDDVLDVVTALQLPTSAEEARVGRASWICDGAWCPPVSLVVPPLSSRRLSLPVVPLKPCKQAMISGISASVEAQGICLQAKAPLLPVRLLQVTAARPQLAVSAVCCDFQVLDEGERHGLDCSNPTLMAGQFFKLSVRVRNCGAVAADDLVVSAVVGIKGWVLALVPEKPGISTTCPAGLKTLSRVGPSGSSFRAGAEAGPLAPGDEAEMSLLACLFPSGLEDTNTTSQLASIQCSVSAAAAPASRGDKRSSGRCLVPLQLLPSLYANISSVPANTPMRIVTVSRRVEGGGVFDGFWAAAPSEPLSPEDMGGGKLLRWCPQVAGPSQGSDRGSSSVGQQGGSTALLPPGGVRTEVYEGPHDVRDGNVAEAWRHLPRQFASDDKSSTKAAPTVAASTDSIATSCARLLTTSICMLMQAKAFTRLAAESSAEQDAQTAPRSLQSIRRAKASAAQGYQEDGAESDGLGRSIEPWRRALLDSSRSSVHVVRWERRQTLRDAIPLRGISIALRDMDAQEALESYRLSSPGTVKFCPSPRVHLLAAPSCSSPSMEDTQSCALATLPDGSLSSQVQAGIGCAFGSKVPGPWTSSSAIVLQPDLYGRAEPVVAAVNATARVHDGFHSGFGVAPGPERQIRLAGTNHKIEGASAESVLLTVGPPYQSASQGRESKRLLDPSCLYSQWT